MTIRKLFIINTVLSLFLFIVIYSQFYRFFDYLLPYSDKIQFTVNSLSGQFWLRIAFAFYFGITPILVNILWYMAPIQSTKKRILSYIIIFSFLFLSIIIRYFNIESNISNMPDLTLVSGEAITNLSSIDGLNYGYYLLASLISGSLLSYFLLKEKNN